jgi:hypothetical protein
MTSPDVAYAYDSSSVTGNANTKGRLTGETALMNGSVWTKRLPYFYDQMGRLKGEQQCTPENCSGAPYTLAYTFDLAGDMTSSTNGLSNPGVLLTYGRDGTGRLSSLTSSWEDAEHPTPLFAPPTASNTYQYDAAGQLLNANLAVNSMAQPAITLANTYDKRLRPLSATDAGGNSGNLRNGHRDCLRNGKVDWWLREHNASDRNHLPELFRRPGGKGRCASLAAASPICR